MFLTTKGRYAVMAMVDMAFQNRFMKEGDSKPISISDISERQNITTPYLEQIFSKLRAGGLVKSQRGPGGGYVMLKRADEINLADIVCAVDEPIKIVKCGHDPDKGCMATDYKCITHDLWDCMERQIEGYLRSVTLQDVLNKDTDRSEIFEDVEGFSEEGSERDSNSSSISVN